MLLFAKKNDLIFCDSLIITFILKFFLFKKINFLSLHYLDKVMKISGNKNKSALFILSRSNNKIFQKKQLDHFFKQYININFLFLNNHINLMEIRDSFHKSGFFEIISCNFYFKKLFSSINLYPNSDYLISGENPGNPMFSSFLSRMKIFKYANPNLQEYKWISYGDKITLNKSGFLSSKGTHIRNFSKSRKILSQLKISFDFILDYKKDTNFAIFFNLLGPGKKAYYEMRVVSSLLNTYLVVNNLQNIPTIIDKMILPKNKGPNFVLIDFNKKYFNISLNSKLFVNNINIEKFNSFVYGIEVLTDDICINNFKEEVRL